MTPSCGWCAACDTCVTTPSRRRCSHVTHSTWHSRDAPPSHDAHRSHRSVTFALYPVASPPVPARCTFALQVTQERLVDGMVLGFTICFPMVFVVLFFSTGSLRVAVLATVTIALIVGTLLGMAQVSAP